MYLSGLLFPRIGICDRGDASCFQPICNQTHGLVADGSDGRQQGHIHVVFPALPDDFRPAHFNGFAVIVIGQGPIVAFAQASEYP